MIDPTEGTFDGRLFVVGAGTVLGCVSDGSVTIERRMGGCRIFQRLSFHAGEWHYSTRQVLDADAAPVVVVGGS